MGSFTLVAFNINRMIGSLGQLDEVLAFIEDDLNEEEARGLAAQINALDNIYISTFEHRDDALEALKESNPAISAGLNPDNNPLRHRFIIRFQDIELSEQTIQEIYAIEGIGHVRNDARIREALTDMNNVANFITIALVILLSGVSILIVGNTIKLATYERREEIEIMRVVGATKRFIRFPFFIEGALLGLSAGLVAYFMQMVIYNAVVDGMNMDFLQDMPIASFAEVNIMVLTAFILGGLLAGSLGTALAIRRFLRK